MKTCRLLTLAGAVLPAAFAAACPVSAQEERPGLTSEEVIYDNPVDGTRLTATLTSPATGSGLPSTGSGRPTAGAGHPAVIVLSIAGTGPLVARLANDGYLVLSPVRRGFVDVEPLLRASYDDLAADVRAGLDYLAGHPDVDAGRIAVVAQADDAPPAILAVAGHQPGIPLVLLAPPAFPGVEEFRREQRFSAQRARWSEDEIEALDGYVERIAEIALGSSPPYVREYQLGNLRAASPVQLPRSAAFPADEGQMHFFASPLWHDRLAFDPAAALAELHGPALVLIGSEDANTPVDRYLEAMRAHLDAARTRDGAVCLLPGRTRHTFTDVAVSSISRWLADRISAVDGANASGSNPGLNRPGPDPAASC